MFVTAHPLCEFHNFPWEELKTALKWRSLPKEKQLGCKQVGGISYGGVVGEVDFNPRRPHIDFVWDQNGVLHVDAWEVPDALETLMDQYIQLGKGIVRDEIRSLIKEILMYVDWKEK